MCTDSIETTSVDVSIVVPAYRQARQLRHLLESLAGLEGAPPFEVVVVDDCSPDETGAVVESWRAQQHPFPTHYVRLERNSGPAAARNAGTARARGRIVAYTDSDCRVTPSWLSTLIRKLDEEAGVVGVGGAVLPVNPKGFFSRYNTVNSILEPPEPLLYLVTANCCYYRSSVQAVGGFDEDVLRPGGEDVALCVKMTRKEWRFAFDPEAVVLHDYREGLRSFVRTWKNYAYGCGYVVGKYLGKIEPEEGVLWHKDSIRPVWLWSPELRTAFETERMLCQRHGISAAQTAAFQCLRFLQLLIHYEYFRKGEAVFLGRAPILARCKWVLRILCRRLLRACRRPKEDNPV